MKANYVSCFSSAHGPLTKTKLTVIVKNIKILTKYSKGNFGDLSKVTLQVPVPGRSWSISPHSRLWLLSCLSALCIRGKWLVFHVHEMLFLKCSRHHQQLMSFCKIVLYRLLVMITYQHHYAINVLCQQYNHSVLCQQYNQYNARITCDFKCKPAVTGLRLWPMDETFGRSVFFWPAPDFICNLNFLRKVWNQSTSCKLVGDCKMNEANTFNFWLEEQY